MFFGLLPRTLWGEFAITHRKICARMRFGTELHARQHHRLAMSSKLIPQCLLQRRLLPPSLLSCWFRVLLVG
jgi:hypothetical protein